jgi:uncharacterized OB-fold protein
MDDGPCLTATVTDQRDSEIGQRVRLEFRRIYDDGETGIINYGYNVVPIG